MKQTIHKIRVSKIADVIQKMGMQEYTMTNLTIETVKNDFLTLFNYISQEAQSKGLTKEILEELLADES
ncbi:MAG: hypothetical protein F6J86_09410 [Symploca sp. SIO1B1]|nr:hypothetical protein [Symploca sp. SIO1B1]